MNYTAYYGPTKPRPEERPEELRSHYVMGVEAMASAEAAITSVRRLIMPEDVRGNNKRLYNHNVLVEEECDQSLIRIQNYQHQAARYYNKRVKEKRFEEGYLVLRKAFENKEEWKAGKLGANWEGPYVISKIVRPGVYQLMEMNGTAVPRSWNEVNLKKYYYLADANKKKFY